MHELALPTVWPAQQNGEPQAAGVISQGMLPCLTKEGRVIMAAPDRFATAPDGNGGIFLALHRCVSCTHAGTTSLSLMPTVSSKS